jgi:cytochrome P450
MSQPPGHTAGADVVSRLVAADGTGVRELPDHLLALLIAARETTASLITWSLLELAEHPEIAETLPEEAALTMRQPSTLLAAGSDLDGLRAVLSEVERLHSPNAISVRKTLRACSIGGFDIAAGTLVAYSPAADHLLAERWPDPAEFRPGRHRARAAAGLLTFGRGLHMCLGRQLAETMTLALLAAVLAEHRVSVAARPAKVRYLPVKVPCEPVDARIEHVRRRR